MHLKTMDEIEWRDLPYIEHPFHAAASVELASDSPFDSGFGTFHGYGLGSMSESRLSRLREELKRGTRFLVGDADNPPFSPVIVRDDRGRLKIVVDDHHSSLRGNLQWLIVNLPYANGSSRPKASLWDKALGAAKQVVNDAARRNAAALADSMGLRPTERRTGRAVDLATEGADLLPPANAAQQEGARWLRAQGFSAAAASLLLALGTRGRAALRRPDAFVDDVKAALKNSRSVPEALGKAGLNQAKRRNGHTTDPRYIDRYHGPDDITRGPEGRLAEWEAKGTRRTSRAVARDGRGNRQGSSAKNEKRATLMTRDKARKIGQPSNRQGGPYTREEIDLWREIRLLKGNKQHLSVHVNTETGMTRVYNRDKRGIVVGEPIDEFRMENFGQLKQVIEEAFRK